MHAPRSLGAFGITMVLGLFGASGVFRACAPPPPPVSAPVGVTTECVALINSYRSAHGVAGVTADKRITTAAEAHSTDQAQRNKMTHTGANGSNAGQRLNVMGYSWKTWGENVAAGQPNCSNVMTAWMNSAGHRANILNPAFAHVGIGAVKSSNGTMYWTLDFAAPR
jgi:uncharacterized protein YkwD